MKFSVHLVRVDYTSKFCRLPFAQGLTLATNSSFPPHKKLVIPFRGVTDTGPRVWAYFRGPPPRPAAWGRGTRAVPHSPLGGREGLPLPRAEGLGPPQGRRPAPNPPRTPPRGPRTAAAGPPRAGMGWPTVRGGGQSKKGAGGGGARGGGNSTDGAVTSTRPRAACPSSPPSAGAAPRRALRGSSQVAFHRPPPCSVPPTRDVMGSESRDSLSPQIPREGPSLA